MPFRLFPNLRVRSIFRLPGGSGHTFALRFATQPKGKGRWVTIGAKEGPDGKKHGGSPVFIENGRITKGHPSLTGRKIGALKEGPEESTHRKDLNRSREYARAVWGKKARHEGLDPKHLHQLAGEMLAHDREFKGEHVAMLKEARRALEEFGGKAKAIALHRGRGREDASSIRGIDEVAEEIARQYPHQFAGGEHASDRLYELLQQGNPGPMSQEDAYTEAFNHLAGQKHEEDVEQPGMGDAAELGDSVEGEPGQPASEGDADPWDLPEPSGEEGAIPEGEADYLDGYFVTNRGGTYQLQTDRGAVNGSLADIRAHIRQQQEQEARYQPLMTRALERAREVQGGNFFGGGTDDEAAAFQKIPAGEPVVSLAEHTYGRLGKVVKDETGRNRVKLNGTPGYGADDVEPLDKRWSWRARQTGEYLEPARDAPARQGALFGPHS